MFQKNKLRSSMVTGKHSCIWGRAASMAVGTLFSTVALAQQVGTIEGQVSLADDLNATGVTVTATSDVMPRPRTVMTDDEGEFKLPMLIPGIYTVTFTAEDGTTRTVKAEVLLDQVTVLDVNLLAPAVDTLEELVVTGEMVTVGNNASLSDAIGAEVLEDLPVGQDYRDLLKLAPGAQYSENSVRGPNAGGSGQDNVYLIDGVDATLPMYGTLSSEPSTQDVEQFSIERGGARAIGFNRSGGMTVNTISKSGTNEFKGSVEYKIEPSSLRADAKDGVESDVTQTWMSANVSGPLIEDKLFFYGSYYGPRETADNTETAYGDVKDYSSVRDEYYGKLTYAPIDSVLLNAAYRTSDRKDEGASIGEYEADSVSVGEEAYQDILTLDGSWLATDNLTVSFQYSDYSLETSATPDTIFDVVTSAGESLDIYNLDEMGYFNVPTVSSIYSDAYNDLAQDLIDLYGYESADGTMTGGGAVGGYYMFNVQNFYRESFEMAVDYNFDIGSTSHDLHVGYQWKESTEEIMRLSNGWGTISMVDGVNDADAPDDAMFVAAVQAMSFITEDGSTVASLTSSTETHNFEINDSISWGDFTFDVGVLISQDTLYGQGLEEDSSTVSGYVVSPGSKYEMYQIDWEDMIQPRLGVTWAYNGADTVFFSFAQYNPEVTSLARAASWDRNTASTMNVYFDADGNYLSSSTVASSSGKLFVDDMDPRRTDEFTIGTTKEFDNGIFLRSHVRYRYTSHFWEDTPNNARLYGCYGVGVTICVPDDIAAKGLYIDNLDELIEQLGGGSSYVIAELDDAYTKYWEFSLDASWRGERTYLNASYTYSRYTGNFDQDNTTYYNDANIYVGSSYIADGIGRQVWDYKEGTLSGDKPHLLKLFGQYTLDWNANVGVYFVYQSGEAWETWDGSIYGYTSSTNRYAEDAGTHRGPSHWQVDLSYTQNFKFYGNLLKFRADIYNLFDRQDGYNIDPYYGSETYGEPLSYYDPRSVQLSVALDF